MNAPTKVDGIDYSPQGIRQLRDEIIDRRDRARKEWEFHTATLLTHTIVLLEHLADLVEAQQDHAG